jgi:outer membrane protein assembly factor BamD
VLSSIISKFPRAALLATGLNVSRATLAAGAIAIVLTACGSDPKDAPASWTAERIYKEAQSEASSGAWDAAIKLYERLENKDPFGVYAQQAQLEIAYANWKSGEPTAAIAAADRFIKLHPNSPSVDYALYLKGLINFNENQGFFAALGGQDLTERDPKTARDSFDNFKELVTRFPDSKYSKDAGDRMNYLVNALASHETHVARYYLRRGAPLAAVNRAQFAIRTYPTAPAVEEALAIMVVGYEDLNQPDLKADAQRVLSKNFPQSNLIASVKEYKPGGWWRLW